MSEKHIKRCRICGAEYDGCVSCDDKRSWLALTDTQEHFYILCVLMDYKIDRDAKRAYDALKRRGFQFGHKEVYLKGAASLLDEIKAKGHPKEAIVIKGAEEEAEESE